MTDSNTHPLDDLLPVIAEAVERWRQANPPDLVTKQIHKLLDKHQHKVVLKLLGFDTSYSGWTLDHCNGRAGESAAGDYLRNTARDAITDWFEQTFPVQVPDDVLQRLQENMQKEYVAQVRYIMQQKIRDRAQKDVQILLDKLAAPTQLENYLQLLKIINPPE